MIEPIQFFVAGHCKTSGSKRAFVPKGWERPIIIDDCAKSKDWKADVKFFAAKAFQGEPLTGPLSLTLVFTMPRPKSHSNSKGLKPNAPWWHVSRPDVLKCARAVEDALTGIIWRDDSQICSEHLIKRYGERIGCDVTIVKLLYGGVPGAPYEVPDPYEVVK